MIHVISHVVCSVLDLVLTISQMDSPYFIEANPIMRWIMNSFGAVGLVLAKAMSIIPMIFIVWLFNFWKNNIIVTFLWLANTVIVFAWSKYFIEVIYG